MPSSPVSGARSRVVEELPKRGHLQKKLEEYKQAVSSSVSSVSGSRNTVPGPEDIHSSIAGESVATSRRGGEQGGGSSSSSSKNRYTDSTRRNSANNGMPTSSANPSKETTGSAKDKQQKAFWRTAHSFSAVQGEEDDASQQRLRQAAEAHSIADGGGGTSAAYAGVDWKKIHKFEEEEEKFYAERHNSLAKSSKFGLREKEDDADSLDSSPKFAAPGEKNDDDLLFQVELSDNIIENSAKYQEEHKRILGKVNRQWARKFRDFHKDTDMRHSALLEQITCLESLIETTEEYRCRREDMVAFKDNEMLKLEGAYEEALEKLEQQKRVCSAMHVDVEKWRMQAGQAEEAFDQIQKELKKDQLSMKKKMDLKCDHLKKTVRDLKEQVAVLEETVTERNDELSKLRQAETTLKKETMSLQNEKEMVEKTAKNIVEECEAKYGAQLATGKTELEVIKGDNYEKAKEIAELRFQVQKQQQDMLHMQREYELQMENARIKGAVESVKLHLHVNQQQNDDYDIQVAEINSQQNSPANKAESSIVGGIMAPAAAESGAPAPLSRASSLSSRDGASMAGATVVPRPSASKASQPVAPVSNRFAPKGETDATKRKPATNAFAEMYAAQNFST
ncbi:unnamed protein product [Amoebophrya sp. A25]|nr:unnamed protein product [Amoebophrya sp. A25]|eukprot:GSA25T00013704001.1